MRREYAVKTTVTVTADPARQETTVRRTGEKCPISYIQAATPAALAAAYRDAAAYFLDLAGQLSGQPAGLVSQVAAMQAEHKSIFCGEVIA